LGLSGTDFWCLSYQEINALRDVYDQTIWRWAHQQAAIYNANTRFDLQGAMWLADDFLGHGDRQKRIAEAQRKVEQSKRDKMEEDFINFQVDLIKKNKKGKNIPIWAMADWDGIEGTITRDQLKDRYA